MQRSRILRWMAWFVTVALTAQAWLVPPVATAADLQSNMLMICTGNGFQVVAQQGDGALPSSGPIDDHSGGLNCTACVQSAAALGDVLPSSWSIPAGREEFIIRAGTQPLLPRPCRGPTRSRAPPVA
jgi:hypothetical protein